MKKILRNIFRQQPTPDLNSPLMGSEEEFQSWYANFQMQITPTNRVNVAARLLTAAARIGFFDLETRTSVFNVAQRFGAHFLPVHFYSPVPDTEAIPNVTWGQKFDDIPNLAINRDNLCSLLSELAIFGRELGDVTDEPSSELAPGVPNYHWNNVAFGGGDAALLYAMIRKYKPKKIIEIGSGFSTLMGLRGIQKNGSGGYTCIEPYPNENIRTLAKAELINLVESGVQTVPLELFESLEANDILFIDSSHVCKTGSDVTYEFLKIIPHLKKGVRVHVHDIFFPFEYPMSWVVEKQIFWNEQYILMALLAFNNEFSMLIPNQIFSTDERLRDEFQKSFPYSPVVGGGSFWFERVM